MEFMTGLRQIGVGVRMQESYQSPNPKGGGGKVSTLRQELKKPPEPEFVGTSRKRSEEGFANVPVGDPTLQTQRNPERAEIEKRAYDIYLARAGAPGSDLADWLQAEEELQAERRKEGLNRKAKAAGARE
jgi:hypothetical protein